MNPIILPASFYLIDFFNNLNGIAVLTMLASIGMAAILFFTNLHDDVIYAFDEDNNQKYKKKMKYCLAVLGISAFIVVIVPSKETMYKMLAASYVTSDNIEMIQNDVIDLITKIADGIAKARK